ncbi:DNA polymerase III subunit delta [Williamsoniiplasma luminosum]|uniref:DNA polymerase III subunit delta n=2 Tax=Williamsoniiplasma luminosum TaxID=214888 RepID=A0A2K8NXF8_9MOLU|nr:DNA polymerase III subunit delta [Williamsoniiplasma luminosum]ATZ17323.1 DNA polymerase III subunit delta [Williamsoniiplasma luminosum]
MYFIYSDDNFLLKKQTQKIIKTITVENVEIESYSFVENSMEEIINALRSYSFFTEQKIIILEDAWFTTDAKKPLHKTFLAKTFLEVLAQGFNENNILIFTVESNKISNKSAITNWLTKNANVEYVAKLNEQQIKNYINQSFVRKNKTIENQAIDFLVELLPNEMQIINSEITKLLKLSTTNLTLEDAQKNTTNYYEHDIFQLVNDFLSSNINNFIVQYQNYKLFNADNIGLFALMGNNLSILRDALILDQKGYSNAEIAGKLEINPYRLKMLLMIKKNSINQLNDKIKMLYNLIKRIVTGQADTLIIPEYELIKIMRSGEVQW